MISPIQSCPPFTSTAASNTIVPLSSRYSDFISSAAIVPTSDNAQLHDSFYHNILSLVVAESPRGQAEAVSRLLRTFPDESGKNPAFVTLEKQVAALTYAHSKVEKPDVKEAIQTVLLGTMNLQSQMVTWLQEIVSTNGGSDEFGEW